MPKESRSSSQPKCSLHDWASLRSELLFIYDQPIPAASGSKKGSRGNDFSAWLVRKGWARIKADGQECMARPGQWLICFGKEIEQTLSPNIHLLSLRIEQAWPDGTPLFSGGTVHLLDARKHPALEKQALQLLKTVEKVSWDERALDPREAFLWRTQLDYVSYINYERRLLGWVAELASSLMQEGRRMHVPGKSDARLKKAFHVLDSLSPGQSFPEKEMCRVCGLSIGRLNHLCVQAYGFTTHAYWEKRRLDRAKRVLELPNVRIKELCAELGFIQLSHFSAWFKRHCGVSPRTFRQKMSGRAKV